MDEFTKMLQEEMSYLDDIESQKGKELRKDLGIEQLQGSFGYLLMMMKIKLYILFLMMGIFRKYLKKMLNSNLKME